VYGQIGSQFVEAWSRLLAAEAGDDPMGQLSKATAYFRRVDAKPYLRRCDELLAASA